MADLQAYFLDTNILMYAAGSDHPLGAPCRQALRQAVDQEIPLITDAEVLQEILYRYFSIGRPDTARTVHRSAVDLCEEVLPIEVKHTTTALELLSEFPELTPRDAIHIAAMQSHGLELLLSTDDDFDAVNQIKRVDPAEFPRSPEL